MLPLTKHLRGAILHGEYMKACADMERTGVPLDVPTLHKLQAHWDEVRAQLAGDAAARYDIFEGLHFSHEKFEKFLSRQGLGGSWPRTEKSHARQLNKETWEVMCGLNPELEPLRQFYKTITMPRLNIACDLDGRNRVLLGAFGAITSRNTPGSDERGTFIFAPAKWARFLIKPPEGMAVAYLDWASQEYGIGAILSGDSNMLRSYEAGDPYMAFAILAGAAPSGATKDTHGGVRKLYKSATLAIGYGQTPRGFNAKTKVGVAVAQRVFRDYYRTYSKFINWRDKQVDNYGLSLRLSTRLGWTLHHGERVKPNTLLNFGAQATGAEMLRLAIIEMRRRGVSVCCPVHDAVLIQARDVEIEAAVAEAQAAMNSASALLLDGYVLRADCTPKDIFKHPQRFIDKDGKDTWEKVSSVVERLGD